MLLAIVMCLGMLNLTALADEGDSSGGACEACGKADCACDVDGVCGESGDAPAWYDADAPQEALKDVTDGRTVTLDGNYMNAALTIGSGVNVTLDLAGHTLKGNGEAPVITIDGGTLILKDSSGGKGTITGGGRYSYDRSWGEWTCGGGVYIAKGAMFIMDMDGRDFSSYTHCRFCNNRAGDPSTGTKDNTCSGDDIYAEATGTKKVVLTRPNLDNCGWSLNDLDPDCRHEIIHWHEDSSYSRWECDEQSWYYDRTPGIHELSARTGLALKAAHPTHPRPEITKSADKKTVCAGDEVQYTVIVKADVAAGTKLVNTATVRSYADATEATDTAEVTVVKPDSDHPDPKDPDPDEPDPDEPTTDIPEDDVPMTDIPEDDVPMTDIPEVDTPLTDVPQTGDNSRIWGYLALISGAGLAWLVLKNKKREDTAE